MRVLITLNMPSRNGNSVHQVSADVEQENMRDFCDHLTDNDFIIVNEIYRNSSGGIFPRGKLILNTKWIGKAKEFDDDIDKAS